MVFGSQEVLCPFYKDETKNTIRCEGLISDACINNFVNKKEKKEHKEIYCCDDYKKCPIAEALYLKY